MARRERPADRVGLDLLVEGVQMARRILDAPSLALHGGGELYTRPGQSNAEVRRTIAAHADTIYHPVGTCRMGGDARSVVDPQLRVRSVERLRIVDASVMPTLIGGNTDSSTVMIGERAAELIAASRRGQEGTGGSGAVTDGITGRACRVSADRAATLPPLAAKYEKTRSNVV